VFAFVLFAACRQDVTGPQLAPPPGPARATADDGPPQNHHFGRDQYQIGVYTGEGVTAPGLVCADPASDVRQCEGYLASEVDNTRLDVTVQIPVSAAKPVPLVTLVHGYAGSKTG